MKPHSYTIVIREKDNVLTSLVLKRPHESFLKPLCKVVEDKHYENEFDYSNKGPDFGIAYYMSILSIQY